MTERLKQLLTQEDQNKLIDGWEEHGTYLWIERGDYWGRAAGGEWSALPIMNLNPGFVLDDGTPLDWNGGFRLLTPSGEVVNLPKSNVRLHESEFEGEKAINEGHNMFANEWESAHLHSPLSPAAAEPEPKPEPEPGFSVDADMFGLDPVSREDRMAAGLPSSATDDEVREVREKQREPGEMSLEQRAATATAMSKVGAWGGGGGHHKKRRRKSKRKSKRRSTRRKSTRRKTKKRKSKGRKSRRRRR